MIKIMVPYYYVRTQEKVEIALLDMFNNIKVNKYTDLSRKNYTKTIRVPIVINQDKNFANWYRSTNHQKQPLPIPIGGLRYSRKEQNNENRTQATYARAIFSKATEQWIRDIQPTPYYLYYDLEFLMDNKSDFGQITENIVPYFNTFRTLRIKEFDFAPDIERKIPVYLMSVSDEFEDELDAGAEHRFIKAKFTFRVEVDWYRPFEIPEMIKYAELNYRIDDITHTQQVFVYPDPIAEQEKKKWEQLDPSTRTGYTLLKTMAKTLIKEDNVDGTTTWVDVTLPDADRPQEVPDYKLLHLNFDDDTSLEDDQSGFGRDFVALNDSTRTYIADLPPGAGQNVEDGYQLDPSVEWNKILNWFGTNDGLNESPFSFKIILQFNDDPVPDTIFQFLTNDETTDSDGNVIPAGEVYFDWGLIDSQLYFTFKTYGTDALYYTFKTKNKLVLNNTDIYKFTFVLYDEGYSGMFGYSVNGGAMIALETIRE
jgi:hypothetical protein